MELLQAAFSLFEEQKHLRPIRLIGFGVTNLCTHQDVQARQAPMLFSEMDPFVQQEKSRQLDSAVDKLREQFGSESIRRGNWRKNKPTGD